MRELEEELCTKAKQDDVTFIDVVTGCYEAESREYAGTDETLAPAERCWNAEIKEQGC